ncbi:alpha/beta hydrolase family protein [Hymenobacter cellulosilyticus]|uniref:Alpha/beta fold hydrolase n=1 Tax=Hymenobacter cellulosilyticus TaxID=2932248 RepID=A0A8T9Q5P6_9BACT|nr:alpha/beta fold hydrolase [Hymenobacter cellulosilyticus]UOQ72847.1 alpha/beta fold hydrolase [Hymenobacter cellulosilyticus]
MKLRGLILLLLSLGSHHLRAQQLPRRVFVGIDLQGITDSIQQRYQLPNKNGILVRGVRPQSSAQAAGLLPNDVILKMGSTEVGANVGEFVGQLRQYKVGDKAPFVVLRNGRKIRKTVTFKAFPKDSSPFYEVQYASVTAGANQLRSIITRPTGAAQAKVPMVLFIQGVGCFSVDNPLNRADVTNRIIDSLSRHGYATMRVDKTGMGDSKGTPCAESDLLSEAAGYKAGLAAIRQLPFVDQQNVFITGFSIGGVMAPLVAQGENLKGVVVFGTVSRTFIEYLLENKRNQSQLQGLPADSINSLLRTYSAALHLLLTDKQTPAQVLAKYPAARRVLTFPQHYTYMQQWQDLNLPAYWQQLNAPVLVLRGASDYISYSIDHQLIADVVNRAHPGNASFVLLPDTDHHFNRAHDMAEAMRMDEQANPEKNFEFMRVILNWLDGKQKA